MSSTSIGEHARPYLEELSGQTGFTVALGVLDGPEVVVVARLRGRRRGEHLLDAGAGAGTRRPAYCTAAGKLLLAGLPEPVWRERFAELTLEKHAPNTIAGRRALRSEIERIRQESLAVAEEELAVGVYEIAAPVRSHSGEIVAAMGMEAHGSTIAPGELADALGPHLIAAADLLSARLGYRRADELARGRLAHVPSDRVQAAGGETLA